MTDLAPTTALDDVTDVLGGTIGGPDDALAVLALAGAVTDVMGERVAVAKQVLETAAAGAAGWEVVRDDVGRAYTTTPRPGPKIVDDDAYRAWVAETYPKRRRKIERVNADRLENALARDDTTAAMLREILEAIPGALETDTIVDTDLLDELWKADRKRVVDVLDPTDPDAPEETTLCDPATAETVPGVTVSLRSSPSLRVEVDPAVAARLAGDLRERLGPLELEEGDPDA